ncbi:hypothetical protein TDB9533_03684 [Thalassocella blandensis]|nr:hypothetical protein TDB9533_03684 [Thalassocella blandensis]
MPNTPAPLFIANNLALDFINTAYGTGDQHVDCLDNDKSVLHWLQLANAVDHQIQHSPENLAALAIALRNQASTILQAAKIEKPIDPVVINQILLEGNPIQNLAWEKNEKKYRGHTHMRDNTPASLLYPVAQSLVKLLTEENLHLVKTCEAHDCVLLFHDTTKSHRRRWCSMAMCGNRAKAASHRMRKKN